MIASVRGRSPVHEPAEKPLCAYILIPHEHWLLDRPRMAMLVFVLPQAASGCLYLLVPKGYLPVQNTGLLQVITASTQATSLTAMAERQQALTNIVLCDPDVDHLASFIGVDGDNPPLNTGRMQVTLNRRFEQAHRGRHYLD